MAGVPEKVLNWLYSVLPSEYADVNRTYHDVAETLSAYPSLRPRTEVYTYENGASALLLQLSGTIPVVFRGSSYGFPLQIWVPHAYPRESPIVYVTPSQDMLVRPGQHVSGDGRVYHPYLARWAEFWDKSTLYDFLAVLKGVFAKEPPVRSKVQQQPVQQAPPPVPPTPVEWRRSMQSPSVVSASPGPSSGAPPPPPKPPKPYEQGRPSPHPQAQQDRYSQPPPLPPHPTQQPPPPQNQYQPQRNSYAGQANWQQQQPPQQQSGYNMSPATPVAKPHRPHVQSQNYPPQPYGIGSPVSPMTPENQRASARPYQQPVPPQQPHPANLQHPQQYQQPPRYAAPHTQPPHHQGTTQIPPQPYPPQQHQPSHPFPSQSQPLPPQPAPPPPNLMDMDSLVVTLPSQSGPQHPLPVPPVPPNPEKDALLSALSSTLVAQTRRVVEQNTAAVAPLLAQQVALKNAHAQLQGELEQIEQLEKVLLANEGILVETMHRATHTISSSSSRQPPDVDDVLVAPTVVGNQLYAVVAEERAIAEAIFVLGRGMERGRVGPEVFVRQTRGLAREMFLRKALGRKIARGCGLEGV